MDQQWVTLLVNVEKCRISIALRIIRQMIQQNSFSFLFPPRVHVGKGQVRLSCVVFFLFFLKANLLSSVKCVVRVLWKSCFFCYFVVFWTKLHGISFCVNIVYCFVQPWFPGLLAFMKLLFCLIPTFCILVSFRSGNCFVFCSLVCFTTDFTCIAESSLLYIFILLCFFMSISGLLSLVRACYRKNSVDLA